MGRAGFGPPFLLTAVTNNVRERHSSAQIQPETAMSAPTTFQYAVIKVGDGDDPEVFTAICGIQTVGFNDSAQTATKAIRDCTSPALPPEQKVTVTSRGRELTGSGLYNTAQIALINTLLADPRNYEIVLLDISDPTIPAGTALGTWAGPGVATAVNLATTDNSDATISITIASNGPWTYTPAS
jgi:hypothetical protein